MGFGFRASRKSLLRLRFPDLGFVGLRLAHSRKAGTRGLGFGPWGFGVLATSYALAVHWLEVAILKDSVGPGCQRMWDEIKGGAVQLRNIS